MKKNKTILCSIAVSTMLFSNLFPVVAKTTTIPIQEVNGEKVVQLEELVTAMNGKVVNEGDLTLYTINDKIITTNSNHPAFYSVSKDLVGETIPYKTKEIKGIKVPDCEATAVKDEHGKLLFPVSALEEYVGLKPTTEGFVIKEEEKKEDTTQSNGSSNNSNSNNNSSNSSASNGGITASTSKPNNGSTSSGSSNSSSVSNSKPSGGSTGGSSSNSSSTSKPSNGGNNSGGTTQKPSTPQTPSSNRVPVSAVTAKLPGLGWTQKTSNAYRYRTIGTININGDGMSIHLYGYSDDFYSSVSSVLHTIIPNGASKALGMLNTDSSGLFSSDGRNVSITYTDGTPIVYIN